MRVLIVEDDRDSREMLFELMHMHGAQCWTAHDVESARKVLEEVHPDLVLSDIGLPTEDGYSLLRWLRSRPAPPPPPPVIAVTAFDDVDSVRGAGFVAHIGKPIDIPLLLRSIAEAMRKRESEP